MISMGSNTYKIVNIVFDCYPLNTSNHLIKLYVNKRNISSTALCTAKATDQVVNIFDRNVKLSHRECAARSPDAKLYDYLKDEVGQRLTDRIFDIKRKFNKIVNLGCGRGHVSKHITNEVTKELILTDLSKAFLEQAETKEGLKVTRKNVDEETYCFEENSIDVFISSLNLHWVNDLPGCFKRINYGLKNDGVFLAALFGSDTLFELRCALQLAELEREGGISAHISPFTGASDVGGLLNTAKFTLLTIDVDEIVVGYPSMFELMYDLKGMAENNAAKNRRLHLRRDVLLAASAIYQEMFGKKKEDGSLYVPATFQIIYLVGWKPDPSQPKPLKPSIPDVSLGDLNKLNEFIKNATKDTTNKGSE
ncbi:arginine-hydroxylase NDUFAF5, mitochondrial [Prorops nasuta]|uniref:arginine-hydroxylase NDUFAF5, mitochondrial n=1 Tax=Prorops nasuta TaxID=863751 RepID=UPI0034CE4103